MDIEIDLETAETIVIQTVKGSLMAARCTETDSENTALIDKGLAIREKIAVEAEKYLNISQENEKEVRPEALSEKDIKQRILDTQILSDLQNLTSREVKEQMILTVPLKEKRKRKEKSRSRSSSSSSSSSNSSASSADSTKLMKRLHEERQKQVERKLKEKERLKATETPEEKRLRRLLKKEAKERKRKERMGWDNDYLHYTNTDNPFGDGNLLSTFVWGKKLDREGLTGLSREDLEIRNRQKQEENKRELEKVKKRRQERELERQQREEETALLQRNKEAAQFQEWERQEDQFHLEQARLRSRIRMQDGRAKPIDLLAKYISSEEDVDAVEMHEPYTYLNGLATQDLEDLIEDIKVYKELERGRNLDYWHDITVIVEDELHKLRKLQKQNEYDSAVGRREGIHQAVAKDVSSVFKGKTATQLEELQTKIESKIRNKVEGLDIGYWESLLSQLKAHMARARLRDRHQENLRKKLQVLKAEQGVAGEGEAENQPSTSSAVDPKNEKIVEEEAANSDEDEENEEDEDDNEDEENAANDMLRESFADYDSGGYSPRYLQSSDLEPGTLVISEEDDLQRVEFARLQITQGAGQRVENVITAEERALQREARKGMAGDEAEFSVETQLDTQVYLWSDKYRPRKPRYFNRVHTGFEWNKYNQTHYDMDNPPPKIVQGYKFNIFYPDLIDKGATPEYFLTPCPENKDFALLRFHAGPPYEDIAFKIVNREWEYSYKRGFRCQFHNNIFQLWFHFKRYRYRR
ncbi:Cactin [Frankliniella occidentalis]|nr:Cactin [Frankliniella occidentalis]